MRYGGRTVESSGQEWVEGSGLYNKIWYEGSNRMEKLFILSTTPAGTEIRHEIVPETLRYEIDDKWFTEQSIVNTLRG